ncbi:helix-turn-helix transcriptional regulator [Nocardioides dongkuii]|uniref:helix-turn-helix transcriptional regulator n=1 Tax=Nocardioides dongkuii TaxID=2760089 RepID=UPI0018787060|nr:LuxR C-terminal-related transcriptional regulator [Nocardioides dongkuii]
MEIAMGSERIEAPGRRRAGSSGLRESETAGRARAAEDRDIRADAREDAADERDAKADDREHEQDARDVRQDARTERQDQRDADITREEATKAAHLDVLTARQLEILTLIAEGMSNKAIARQLHLSVNTIKSTIRGVYDRIGVVSRTQAVHWYTHGPRRAPDQREF